MAITPEFVRQRWAKKHHWVLEQAEVLRAQQILAVATEPAGWVLRLADNSSTPTKRPKEPLIRAGVPVQATVYERQAGAARRAFVLCPRCERPVEFLVLPPRTDCEHCNPARKWQCRRCNELIYASQRFGRKHPLRVQGPPRAQRKTREARATDSIRRAAARSLLKFADRL